MELSELGIIASKEHQFNKKGIYTVEDLLRFLPKKYYDFRNAEPLNVYQPKKMSAVTGTVILIQKYEKCVQATIKDDITGKKLKVTWFSNRNYRWKQISALEKKHFICCGEVEYDWNWNHFITA